MICPGWMYAHIRMRCCRAQLPPVAKAGASFKFAFEAARWGECIPRVFELTKVFRQNDSAFITALNHIRVGYAPFEVRHPEHSCHFNSSPTRSPRRVRCRRGSSSGSVSSGSYLMSAALLPHASIRTERNAPRSTTSS